MPDNDEYQSEEVPVMLTRAEWIYLHDFLVTHDEPQGIAQTIADQLEG